MIFACRPVTATVCLAAAMLRPCMASPVTVPLVPATTHIGLTVFAMGLWPLPGQFLRFSGRLTMDPAVPGACRVNLSVEVASLHMDDGQRTPMALGPKLLDAAQFPGLRYDGSCAPGLAVGILTLHGVTRALTLTAHRDGEAVAVSGSLKRGDYGVSGLPGLIGRQVDMNLSVALPPGLAARLAPE